MITVACVLSPGPTYNRSHVHRLEQMVAQHMSQPYQFVCVDDSPFPGWWAKLDLFKPGRFSGRVLYFDLDVTIVGNIDDLAEYPGDFVICRDWLNGIEVNSSVIAWNAGSADRLYTDFTPDVMERLHGDQNWITAKKPDAVRFPRQWCFSYKLGKQIGFPKDMRVCVYHGHPKPWEVDD